MTKRRAPLTFELALVKVAGVIGWDAAAAIVGKAPNTLRNWSDPDTSAQVSMGQALALDVAFRVAGGEGPPPMHQCYRTRLDADTALACADLATLQAQIGRSAKEGGEAIAFAIAAAQPGASDAVLIRAEQELEESLAATTDTLATIRQIRRGEAAPDRAPEVAPPAAVALADA